jgi:hypothetical protein
MISAETRPGIKPPVFQCRDIQSVCVVEGGQSEVKHGLMPSQNNAVEGALIKENTAYSHNKSNLIILSRIFLVHI